MSPHTPIVQALCDESHKKGLERHHTEKTTIAGGKTRGKFKFPKNWKVGHELKGYRES